jgi:hypothetical protein
LIFHFVSNRKGNHKAFSLVHLGFRVPAFEKIIGLLKEVGKGFFLKVQPVYLFVCQLFLKSFNRQL